MRSYLSSGLYKRNSSKMYSVTAGVPQGSIFAPIAWNILNAELLRLLAQALKIIGYGDDVAIVSVAKQLERIQDDVGRVPRVHINAWLTRKNLSLALQRTDAVLITCKRRETVILTVNDHEICTTSKIKYFGVMLDARRSFLPNIRALFDKTGRVHAAFARMMANIGGPSQSRRLLLGKVIMYTVPVWHKSSYAENVNKLI